jgi:hypothetical protein
LLLTLTAALDGDGPVGVTDRDKSSDKSKWQLPIKNKKKLQRKGQNF